MLHVICVYSDMIILVGRNKGYNHRPHDWLQYTYLGMR
jgi:hypothetical protein